MWPLLDVARYSEQARTHHKSLSPAAAALASPPPAAGPKWTLPAAGLAGRASGALPCDCRRLARRGSDLPRPELGAHRNQAHTASRAPPSIIMMPVTAL
jgi:hypothetical protein